MYDMYQSPNQSPNGTTSILWRLTCCVVVLRFTVEAFQQPQILRIDVTNRNSIYTYHYWNDIKESIKRQDDHVRWIIQQHKYRGSTFLLHMAAGSKSLNKQAALRQKLEQAKQQNFEQQQNTTVVSSSVSSSGYPFSDKEIRERNDRLRFEELLQKKGGAFVDSENDKEYKTRQQEDDEIDAVRKYCFTFDYHTCYESLNLSQPE